MVPTFPVNVPENRKIFEKRNIESKIPVRKMSQWIGNSREEISENFSMPRKVVLFSENYGIYCSIHDWTEIPRNSNQNFLSN